MSVSVSNVVNPEFGVPPLESTAASIIQRKAAELPPYSQVDYGHNGQSQRPKTASFHIADAENFVKCRNVMLKAKFRPNFYAHYVDAATNTRYPVGYGPQLDLNTQALISKIRITNAQGIPIEEIPAYNIMCNVLNTHSQTAIHKEYNSREYSTHHLGTEQDALECQSRWLTMQPNSASFLTSSLPQWSSVGEIATVNDPSAERDIIIRFQHSSFMNSVQQLPVFALKNGLRIDVEFEDPRRAFFMNNAVEPIFMGSTNVGTPTSNTDTPGAVEGSYRGNVLGIAPLTVDAAGSNTINGWNDIAKLGTDRASTGSKTVLCSTAATIAAHDTNLLWFKLCQQAKPGDRILFFRNEAGASTGALQANFYVKRSYASETLVDATKTNGIIEVDTSKSYYWTPIAGAAAVEACPNLTGADPAAALNELRWCNVWLIPGGPHSGTQASHLTTSNRPLWDYTLSNLNLLVDFTKPASDVMNAYLQRYTSPEGLSYAFIKSAYHQYTQRGSAAAMPLQIALPFQFRSLRKVVIAISDPYSTVVGGDKTIYNFPSLSSFMTRGLIRAHLQIGAQSFPAYELNVKDEYTINQLVELEKTANTTGSQTFVGNYSPNKLRKHSKNYYLCNGLGDPSGGAGEGKVDNAGNQAALYGFDGTLSRNTFNQGYWDTSRFVLGFSCQKRDGDFTTGVDTSMAGSVILNLYFGPETNGRDRVIHIWGFADAVATIQANSFAVRH